MTDQTVRVRFAPSPTGWLHLGVARTALYNWLYARHTGGTMVLRIEDTDRSRHVEEAVEVILDGLKWLGIDWDEGPVFQSERLEVYREAAEQLKASGAVYEDTDAEGRTALRFRVPEGKTAFDDCVFGHIEVDHRQVEDFVVLKSDGFPTYNFACVVDDADMRITHVIRGNDHLSNTPKQILLYRALGKPVPTFAHLPMIHGSDGTKLSKRHGAVAVTEYREKGFLPQALRNFIGLLGWAPKGDREIVPVEEMIEEFELGDIRKTPSQFDLEKATWMNSQYIQHADDGELAEAFRQVLAGAGRPPEVLTDEFVRGLVPLYRERLKSLNDLVEMTGFFFVDDRAYEFEEKSFNKFIAGEENVERLEAIAQELRQVEHFTPEVMEATMKEFAASRELGMGKVAQPIRVAVTGTKVSPPIFETIALMGRDKTLNRLARAIEMGRG